MLITINVLDDYDTDQRLILRIYVLIASINKRGAAACCLIYSSRVISPFSSVRHLNIVWGVDSH